MPAASPSRSVLYARAILVATLVVVVYLRLSLLALPLERDEGEFALMGQMILDGKPPYAEAYNLKPPGIYLAYAAVMAVFGQTPVGIHAGLLAVNLLAALFLFLIVRILRGSETAALSTAAFLALSAMPKALGLSAHATQFVLLPALWGIWILLKGRAASAEADLATSAAPVDAVPVGAAWAGFLMGVSFLVKQPGIFFILFGALLAARRGKGRQLWIDLPLYTLGVAVPIFLSVLWLWNAGVFERFWFWVVDYAFKYGSEVGFIEGIDIAWSVGGSLAIPALFVLVVGIAGLRRLKDAAVSTDTRFFVLAFLAASALAVAMGLHFRRHYFVLAIPVVSILFGLGIEWIGDRLSRGRASARFAVPVVALIAIWSVGHVIFAGHRVYFAGDPNLASREMFGTNPFVESPLIGEKVREMTTDSDRVAVIGSEPQIYFYAHRRPATGYLYTYSLVEVQPYAATMREEMIGEIERSRPAVVVYVNHPSSWLLRPGSDKSIFTWAEDYVTREGYAIAGVVEVVTPEKTVSIWGEEAANYTPSTGNYIQVWKRAD